MNSSRMLLKKALLEIMKEKSYKDLSVSELCQKAGVSRMAFYRNYDTVAELFNETAIDLNEKIIGSIGSPFRSGTSTEWYETAFKMISDQKDSLELMYQENFQFEWMKVVNSLAVHDESFSAEKKFQRLVWCGGFENVVAQWLNEGMKETPAEMASYCVKYLPTITKES